METSTKKKSCDPRRMPSLKQSRNLRPTPRLSANEAMKRTLHWQLLKRELIALHLTALVCAPSSWILTREAGSNTKHLQLLYQRLENGSLLQSSLNHTWLCLGPVYMHTSQLTNVFRSAYGNRKLRLLSERVPQADWASTLLSLRTLHEFYDAQERETANEMAMLKSSTFLRVTAQSASTSTSNYWQAGAKKKQHWLR